VVEVLGPAAAMLVPAVELGPSGCWSRLGQGRNMIGTLHWVGGNMDRHMLEGGVHGSCHPGDGAAGVHQKL
jgi:hypothetical protein